MTMHLVRSRHSIERRRPGRLACPRVCTVLVVDDADGSRALSRISLETAGYRVLEARSGAEAVAVFERNYCNCVLFDVPAPEGDAFAACKRLRALPGGRATTIVFFTPLRDVDTFDRALLAGGDDFITKPTVPSELVVRVETALKLRQLRSEHPRHYELLKRQHDALIRLQLERERLMAFIVHDLKNPVSAMDLHAQVLLREPALPKGALESVAQIRTAARQLGRMILNILDVSKAGEGKLSPRRTVVDLRALVAEVITELEMHARARNVKIHGSLEVPLVQADQDLLRRMLVNLVENATRHAPPGGEVTVTAVPCPGGSELRVADDGEGVSPEMRERIFDAFVQAESEGRPRAEGGHGLGLTFCKAAALAHGGRIWVEDGTPGAVFCVMLPHDHGLRAEANVKNSAS